MPHFLHPIDEGSVLTAAGLFGHRKTEEGWEVSCAIMTTDGVAAAGDVHDRMPVFLTDEMRSQWLTPGDIDPEEWAPKLTESTETVADLLRGRRVDRKVNNVKKADRNDPTLIEAV